MRGHSREKHFTVPVLLALALAVALTPLTAQAYVGPGAGLSLLSALWGVLCAIGAAFLFLVMWPIRRWRRRRREAKRGETTQSNAATQSNTGRPQRERSSNTSEPYE